MIDVVFVKEMLKDLQEHLEKDEKEIAYRKKILNEWKKKVKLEKESWINRELLKDYGYSEIEGVDCDE